MRVQEDYEPFDKRKLLALFADAASAAVCVGYTLGYLLPTPAPASGWWLDLLALVSSGWLLCRLVRQIQRGGR